MVSAHSTAGGNVVSIGSRADWRPDFKAIAAQQLKSARENSGLDRVAFAARLSGRLGWDVTETALARWEKGAMPPGDVLLAAAEDGALFTPPRTLLGLVPQAFPAAALEGAWLTSYTFSHNGERRHHADIAWVTAESDRQIRAVNTVPEPRTEGRAVPFRNEIEARLVSRHVTGEWKNTSDARYFGAVHLAVLPGEMVMEGHYTGFASDITVSTGWWRWVRLDPGSVAGGLDGVMLREPAALHELVMNHSEYDAPLTLTDVGKGA